MTTWNTILTASSKLSDSHFPSSTLYVTGRRRSPTQQRTSFSAILRAAAAHVLYACAVLPFTSSRMSVPNVDVSTSLHVDVSTQRRRLSSSELCYKRLAIRAPLLEIIRGCGTNFIAFLYNFIAFFYNASVTGGPEVRIYIYTYTYKR